MTPSGNRTASLGSQWLRHVVKKLGYPLLETLTAHYGILRRINGDAIRFPVRWCRYYPSVYEPAKHRFLRLHCRPGWDVLDIGAHIGLFTVVMARGVAPLGRVFSFEPSDDTRRVLVETVRLNGCQRVVSVQPEAVSSTSGQALFYRAQTPACNSNSLVAGAAGSDRVTVQTVSVDEFVSAHRLRVACMKIDAEGSEIKILRGARRTMEQSRPALAVEIHPKLLNDRAWADELWELARAYRLTWLMDGEPLSRDQLTSQRDYVEVQAVRTESLRTESSYVYPPPATSSKRS
jgi:FkbM family methyltransferase